MYNPVTNTHHIMMVLGNPADTTGSDNYVSIKFEFPYVTDSANPVTYTGYYASPGVGFTTDAVPG